QVAGPAEAGLDRRPLGTDVVSVQRVTDLEPKGAARGEAAGDRIRAEQRAPERHGVVGRAAELAAALARVAGAGDQAMHAEDITLAECEGRDVDAEPSKSRSTPP